MNAASDRPVSAKEAALKIILEDLHPLLQRVEESTLLFQAVEKDMKGDLTKLADNVVAVARAQAELQAAAGAMQKALQGATTTFSAAAAQRKPGGAPQGKSMSAGAIVATCALAALVSAAAVGAGLYLVGKDLVEQAKVGRALQSAWPKLDADTRSKLEQTLR